MTVTTRASVIVPTYRSNSALLETLEALVKKDSLETFEIVAVVDGRDTELAALSRRAFPRPMQWVFHEENRGLPAARNTGVRASKGELILFLDDDVVPAPDWLRRMSDRHRVEGPRTIVGGRLIEEYPSRPDSKVEAMLRRRRAMGFSRFHERAMRNGGTFEFAPHCGNNSSLLRATFEELGGFDENQRRMHEDLELGERALAHGIRFVYEPAAIAVHRNRSPAASYDETSPGAEALSDLYRVSHRSQRNERTSRLVSMERGPIGRRLRQSVAWSAPSLAESAGSALVRLAGATGSETALTAGRSLQQSVRDWKALKERGETRDSLAQLDVPPIPPLVVHSAASRGREPKGEERRYHISESRLRDFLERLSRWGFHAVSPSSHRDGTVGHRRPVMLTFDDGYEDFYTTVFPLLHALGLTAAVYVVAGRIGATNDWDALHGARSRRLLSRQQIVELHRHGVIIGSHSVTHPRLTAVDPGALAREVNDSRRIIEDIIGAEVDSFAYPSGQVNERVRSAVATAGYRTAFTTQEGLNAWNDPLLLRRASISDMDNDLSLRLKLATGRGFSGRARGLGIAATKRAVSILPSEVARRMEDRLKDFDAASRKKMWDARARALADVSTDGDRQ